MFCVDLRKKKDINTRDSIVVETMKPIEKGVNLKVKGAVAPPREHA